MKKKAAKLPVKKPVEPASLFKLANGGELVHASYHTSRRIAFKVDAVDPPHPFPPHHPIPNPFITYYVFVDENKEGPPGYRHAWTTVFTTKDKAGTIPVALDDISISLSMPCPMVGEQRDNEEGKNASSVSADVKCAGTALFGAFEVTIGVAIKQKGFKDFKKSYKF